MNTCNTPVFRPESETDRDLFELALLEACTCGQPQFIGEVHTDPALFEQWCVEGRMRSEMNAKRLGDSWNAEKQRIKKQDLTADEIGRLGEGPIEQMLGLDVAAVVEGTDDRPDRVVSGVRFDVKASRERPGNTFSVPVWVMKQKEYDALVLVQHVQPGVARVWCGRSKKDGERLEAWEYRRGKPDFWLIHTEAPELVH